jgi:aminotransferase
MTIQDKILPHLTFDPPALRAMSLKVAACNGMNLAQGVCLLPVPELVRNAAAEAIEAGENRYSSAQGILMLREALSDKLKSFNRIDAHPDNILVTPGSTGAFEIICQLFLQPGDGVIDFLPCYPYHRNPLESRQIETHFVELQGPDWSYDPEALEEAFKKGPKFIIVCNPHNPCGKVFTKEELQHIGGLCQKYGVFCVTDEVYEYMTYDGRSHVSMASLPGMAEHCITMGSYSKTFAITGWRIGYLHAPSCVVDKLIRMLDEVYVCAPTPLQHAVAKGIRELPESYYQDLLAGYAQKRELLAEALEGAGFAISKPAGAYYMLAFTGEAFPELTADQVAEWVIDTTGVGAVPSSDFLLPDAPRESGFLRFNYALSDELIREAGERLQAMKS